VDPGDDDWAPMVERETRYGEIVLSVHAIEIRPKEKFLANGD